MAATQRLRDAHNAHVRATAALERASAEMLEQHAELQRAEAKLDELKRARAAAQTALADADLELQQAVRAEVTR